MEIKLPLWGRFRLWLLWLSRGIKVDKVFFAVTLFFVPHLGADEEKIIVDVSEGENRGIVAIEEWISEERFWLDDTEVEDGEIYLMEDVVITQQSRWKRRLFRKPIMIESVWVF